MSRAPQDPSQPPRPSARGSALPHLLALLGLTSLGLAQPLFDVIGRSPEFLLARGLGPAALLGLVASLWLLPPLVLFAAGASLAGAAGRRASGTWTSPWTIVLSLAALPLAALLARRLPLWTSVALALAALMAGLLGVLATRSRAIAQLLGLLGALSVVVPLAFLLRPGVRGLIFGGEASAASAFAGRTQVALLIFDELPLASLLDEHGEIDAAAFPSFAALRQRAIWFRDALAPATTTLPSVPAILSGERPAEGRLATLQEYPHNLLARLAESHQLYALEPRTALAPERNRSRLESAAPLALAQDLGVVALHLLLPEDLGRHLPDVTTNWDHFGDTADKADGVARFLGALRRSGERPLAVAAHVELPHHPWIYLPSGARYHPGDELFFDGLQEDRGPATNRWIADPWPAAQGMQRHLLQLQYTDRLLGELLERLAQIGAGDALVVVTADHGISFEPGGLVRAAAPDNLAAVAAVPLFVAVPGRKAEVVDDPVGLLGLTPMLERLLDAKSPASLDLETLLAPLRTAPREVFDQGRSIAARAPLWPKTLELARAKARLFPSLGESPGESSGEDRFFHLGQDADLMGRPLEELPITAIASGAPPAELQESADPGSGAVPARVIVRSRGALTAFLPGDRLALAGGGAILATSRAVGETVGDTLGNTVRASFLLPESTLAEASSTRELYLIRGTGMARRLELVPFEDRAAYRIAAGSPPALIGRAGEHIAIDSAAFEGEVTTLVIEQRPHRIELIGWARRKPTGKPADRVVIGVGGRVLASSRCGLDAALARRYGLESLAEHAFVVVLPREAVTELVEVYAVSEGELRASALLVRWDATPKAHPAL